MKKSITSLLAIVAVVGLGAAFATIQQTRSIQSAMADGEACSTGLCSFFRMATASTSTKATGTEKNQNASASCCDTAASATLLARNVGGSCCAEKMNTLAVASSSQCCPAGAAFEIARADETACCASQELASCASDCCTDGLKVAALAAEACCSKSTSGCSGCASCSHGSVPASAIVMADALFGVTEEDACCSASAKLQVASISCCSDCTGSLQIAQAPSACCASASQKLVVAQAAQNKQAACSSCCGEKSKCTAASIVTAEKKCPDCGATLQVAERAEEVVQPKS